MQNMTSKTMDSVENYLPKIHRAITAMFNHKKTVMARTAKKEDTSTYSFSEKKQFHIHSAGTVSSSVCWQQEPQHPPPPVKDWMPAAAVTLNAMIARRMPTCLTIIPSNSHATSTHIGKQSGIF